MDNRLPTYCQHMLCLVAVRWCWSLWNQIELLLAVDDERAVLVAVDSHRWARMSSSGDEKRCVTVERDIGVSPVTRKQTLYKWKIRQSIRLGYARLCFRWVQFSISNFLISNDSFSARQCSRRIRVSKILLATFGFPSIIIEIFLDSLHTVNMCGQWSVCVPSINWVSRFGAQFLNIPFSCGRVY